MVYLIKSNFMGSMDVMHHKIIYSINLNWEKSVCGKVEVGSFLEKIHSISLSNFARMRCEHARLDVKWDTIPSTINLNKKKKKRKILFLLIYLTLLSDLNREWVNLSAILVPLIVPKTVPTFFTVSTSRYESPYITL